jgi:hypothetical protein
LNMERGAGWAERGVGVRALFMMEVCHG